MDDDHSLSLLNLSGSEHLLSTYCMPSVLPNAGVDSKRPGSWELASLVASSTRHLTYVSVSCPSFPRAQ